MAKRVTEQGLAVGRRLKRRRGDMTVGELATYSGVSKAYISQIENGQAADPGVFMMAKFARALRCTIDDLISDPEGETELLPVPRDEAPLYRRFGEFARDAKRRVLDGADVFLRFSADGRERGPAEGEQQDAE